MLRSLSILLLAACVTAPTPPRPERLLPPLPTAFLCRYQPKSHSLQGGTLSLAGTTRPFARFAESRSAAVTLQMPWSEGAPMPTLITSTAVTLRADYTPTGPLRLFPLEPVRLGVVTLRTMAPLSVRGLDGGAFVVEAQALDGFRPAAPLVFQLPCSKTSISARFSREHADGGTPVELMSDQLLPLTATPGGPSEGELVLESGTSARAVELAREGEWVQVRREAWPGTVTGWVPSRAVSPVAPPDGGLSNVFGVGGLGTRSKDDKVRCAEQVPLFLRRDGVVTPIGQLLPKAAVVPGPAIEGFVEVALPELNWLELEAGVAWVIEAQDVARCLSKR